MSKKIKRNCFKFPNLNERRKTKIPFVISLFIFPLSPHQPFCFFAISCTSSSVLFLHWVERNLRTDFEIAPSAFLDFENISK